MTDSNLVQFSLVEETGWGIPPVTPVMQLVRYTGEDLRYSINNVQSQEINSDSQVSDLIQVDARVNGGYNFEFSFGAHDEQIAGALRNTWLTGPVKYNAGVADSVITDAGTTAGTYAVVSGGTDFVVGMLVRASGFDPVVANNQVFRVSSSTETTVVGAAGLTAQSSPPGTARLKMVGFQGVAGDITATETGLASTLLNFTTLGLREYDMIKIGGTAVGDQFATPALNTWVRVAGTPTATVLPLDNLPAGWAIDAGTGKTIKVWTGDQLKNGATLRSFTVEKGYLGVATPLYIPLNGIIWDNFSLDIRPGAIVSGSMTCLGKAAGAATTTAMGASYLSATTGDVINAVADVVLISEGGTVISTATPVVGWSIQTTNSLFEGTAVGVMGLARVGMGTFSATGTLQAYFETASLAMYNKMIAGTATSLAAVMRKNGAAYAIQFPKVKLAAGTPSASGRDQFVILDMEWTGMKDAATGKTVVMNRFDYTE